MKLSDFPYRTTSGLVKYSKLVTKSIALYNLDNAYSTGPITHDPDCGLPSNEDLLEYWDNSKREITFGRYLLFKNKKREEIKFWTGLNSPRKKKEMEYGIWFKEDDPFKQYVKKLQENNYSNATFENEEVWIPMKKEDFDEFCNGKNCANCKKQMIKNFLHSVLQELLK
jgi:hypothetical protein